MTAVAASVPDRRTNSGPAHPVQDSPAYKVLIEHNLLNSSYRVNDLRNLDTMDANSTPLKNTLMTILSFLPCCWPCCLCGSLVKTADVPAGCVKKMEDGRGGYHFLGNKSGRSGNHFYYDAFYTIDQTPVKLNTVVPGEGMVVENGTKWIVVVPQGFVGLAYDMGQPVLLPPGLHQWESGTMKFVKAIDLNQPIIDLGPYTLLTVDKGYEAVTQNNGQQTVLSGGQVHLLTHRNWKFEKFMTSKIQTDDLKRIEVMTGDNVLMFVDATVCWNIDNVQKCAERAAVTMHTAGREEASTQTVQKLRADVLKQAEASLSALIGKVNFSGTFSAATAVQVGQAVSGGKSAQSSTPQQIDNSLLFDIDKLSDAVLHANEMTQRYGVDVLSINIISAKPESASLMESLAKGAVAAAEAQQLETTARGHARAATIRARGDGEATLITAQADADAEITRAKGSNTAAGILEEHEVAVRLATIGATGQALGNSKSNLILGAEPSSLSNLLLANPNVLK